MKGLIIAALAIVAWLALPQEAAAQRYLPGQKGIQVAGGMTDGFSLVTKDGDSRFWGELCYSVYNRNKSRWLFSAAYLQKDYPYKDIRIPKVQFTGEAGYYIPFVSNRGKDFFISVGASALAGYETSNWDKKLLFDGATITDRDTFLYGFSAGFEAEVFVADRVVLLFSAKERFAFGSTIGKTHTLIGAGIKFIFN